jgi:hypothetical protein
MQTPITPKTVIKMSVTLRQRSVCKGTKLSFYLDINHNGERWTETIKEFQINKHNQTPEDKEKKLLAQQIRVKRENELIVEGHDLPNKALKKIDFIAWFGKFAASRKESCKNYYHCFQHAEKYTKGKRVSFSAITVKWLRGFSANLQENLKQNTARTYFICLYIALEEAEKQDLVRKTQ